ncbi:DUF2213 domain-containing protein [Xenorhabdus hominickii]|uniref:Uncharacterized protein n=1 Tax=Xenorhabdus hominickii TaxID=351679 RepID=A0A2G0Q637_XENHO|nr:DUF2213 domain-containing protein [Xenorhabdus hominickii]AOM39550.1 hypothetical protein A9255_02420 [Xenorhabdus hominickii]PHM54676.1 hypothetical protein Xhom_02627 [Xenorhabdus hominickii]
MSKEKNSVVFDEGSRRRIDANGYLHVSQTHLTKEQVVPYIGREIPGWENLELEPDRLYYGSVSVSFAVPDVANASWFKTTPCGQMYWQATRKYVVGGRYSAVKHYHPWG